MSNAGNDGQDGGKPPRFLGSLKDALLAAGRSDAPPAEPVAVQPPPAEAPKPASATRMSPPPLVDKAAAVDAETVVVPPKATADSAGKPGSAGPMTHLIRGSDPRKQPAGGRTQLLRGRVEVTRTDFHQDPVVGWLVVVGGNGLGAFRPIFEGNNTIGRSRTQRIAIDFGDEAISNEEQAYIRYDAADRSFLFVPNMAKTNVVSINNRRPTATVQLQAMDVITMGRTQLAFVPFCGQDFDWSELAEAKS